jgi:inorganic pyrophosphatase
MKDEKGPDAKVLCVPSRDARYAQYRDLGDAPEFLLAEIANFFEVYKLIEPGKESTVGSWANAAAAEQEIRAALERHSH